MPTYIDTIIYLFAFISLGYVSVATGYLKSEISDALVKFIYYVGVPFLLYRLILHADFGSGNVIKLWTAYFGGAAIIWAISHFVIQHFFKRDTRAGVVAGITGAFSNCVLVGIPFIDGVFGDAGTAVLSQILTVHLPVMLATTIVLLEWANRRDGVYKDEIDPIAILRKFLTQLLSNPLVIAIACAFISKLIGFNPPSVAARLIESLGDTVGPIALFALGMAVRKYGISGQISPAIVLVTIKLMIMPAVVLSLALLIGLPEFTTRVIVSTAALPVGINSWVLAQQFGTGQRLASTSITIGTASALTTAGIWLWICDIIFT